MAIKKRKVQRQFALWVPVGQLRLWRAAADRRGLSVAAWIRDACAAQLKKEGK